MRFVYCLYFRNGMNNNEIWLTWNVIGSPQQQTTKHTYWMQKSQFIEFARILLSIDEQFKFFRIWKMFEEKTPNSSKYMYPLEYHRIRLQIISLCFSNNSFSKEIDLSTIWQKVL